MGPSLSTSSFLTPALFGFAIVVTSLLPVPHAAAQTSRNSAVSQIQALQADFAAAQLDVSRDFLVEFADNLKTFADFGKLLYDFGGLKPPPDASAATRAFFDRIKPTQDWLARGGGEVPDQHEFLQAAYDLVNAVRQDLARPRTDPMMATLSSNTLEKLGDLGLQWITSSDNLQKWVDAGNISKPFAKYTGFLSFGADDLVAGIARGVGSGNWKDPETVAHLLDAFNRGTWAAVGYLASGGNREVADVFSSAAGFAGATVRDHTVDFFANAYMKYGGVNQAILDQYASAQQALIAHHQAPVSFEEFVKFDPQMLRAISPTQRSAADARFGLQAPPSPPPDTTQVITHTSHEFYSDVCRSGFCVHTDLTAPPTANPPPKEGGVRINPRPLAAGKVPAGFADRILSGCAGAVTPACGPR